MLQKKQCQTVTVFLLRFLHPIDRKLINVVLRIETEDTLEMFEKQAKES